MTYEAAFQQFTQRCVEKAQHDDPDGSTCNFCNNPNDLADDNGWFYIHPSEAKEGYCCQACYDGTEGRKHVARWGMGER